MYTLKTKGGDHLAMRPEHTASLMRAYIEHGMQNEPQPVMFYHTGPVFRHDPSPDEKAERAPRHDRRVGQRRRGGHGGWFVGQGQQDR